MGGFGRCEYLATPRTPNRNVATNSQRDLPVVPLSRFVEWRTSGQMKGLAGCLIFFEPALKRYRREN
jgi:hypothetical protein